MSILDTILGREPMDQQRRYDRQCLIPGWNQDALADAGIAIIGSSWLAFYAGTVATALGFGRVTLLGDGIEYQRSLLGLRTGDATGVEGFATVMSRLNPLVGVEAYPIALTHQGAGYFLDGHEVILDLTNDAASKAIAMTHARSSNAFLTLAANHTGKSKLRVFSGDLNDAHCLMHEFAGTAQDPVTSLPIAALAVEEARRHVMGQETIKSSIYYAPGNAQRFGPGLRPEPCGEPRRLDTVLLVGAGALGNGIAMQLPHLGVRKVYVMDMDTVEDTNLNRQVLFHNAVGKKKASALASRIEDMGIRAVAINDKFPSPRLDTLNDIDAMFDCVDNFTARYEMSRFARERQIILISGGTDYQSGQVALFAPGATQCIDHQLGLAAKVLEAEEQARQSCVYAPNPSVVTSNMIISGFMGAEFAQLARGALPLAGTLKYGSSLERRVGFNRLEGPCACAKEDHP